MSLKAPTGLLSDEVVVLPAEAVEKSSGFALDIGSTIGKLIYRSNKEYKDGKPLKKLDDPSKGQVHYAMFPRDDHEGMVKYIKENADLTKNEEGVILVKSSGVGGQAFKVQIETGLNCKMEVLTEFDCFINAFLAMEKTHTKEELFVPHSDKAVATAKQTKEMVDKSMENMEKNSDMKLLEGPGVEVTEEDRPRLFVMAGSGSGIMQINKDGSFLLVDGIYTGGRFMYGLASFLSGENDFSKLVKMAESADGRTAGTFITDLMPKRKEGEEENMYNQEHSMDMLVFPFGKGVTTKLEDAKKEDLVHNVFDVTARNHASSIAACCRMTGATEVFLCGNVFNSEIMREMTVIHKMMVDSFLPPKAPSNYHFIKNGGMMGALGAFLHVKKEQ